jgi:hypothetical protein
MMNHRFLFRLRWTFSAVVLIHSFVLGAEGMIADITEVLSCSCDVSFSK